MCPFNFYIGNINLIEKIIKDSDLEILISLITITIIAILLLKTLESPKNLVNAELKNLKLTNNESDLSTLLPEQLGELITHFSEKSEMAHKDSLLMARFALAFLITIITLIFTKNNIDTGLTDIIHRVGIANLLSIMFIVFFALMITGSYYQRVSRAFFNQTSLFRKIKIMAHARPDKNEPTSP